MDLILEVRTGREQVTMACHGKLIGGKEADAFRSNAILLMGGFDKLVINFAGVRAVDCGGLGSLAAVLAAAVDKSRQVRTRQRLLADPADASRHSPGTVLGAAQRS